MTGVGTLLLNTRGVIGTVSVGDTLGLVLEKVWLQLGCAGHQGVAHPARGTRALGHVVLD